MFLAYISGSDAKVYAAKIGDETLHEIGNLRKKFSVYAKGETPLFSLEIRNNDGIYWVMVYEANFKQNSGSRVPSWIFRR